MSSELELIQAYIATRKHTNERGMTTPLTDEYLNEAFIFENETEAQLFLGALVEAIGGPRTVSARECVCEILRDKLLKYCLEPAQEWQREQQASDRYERDLEHGKVRYSDRDEATGIPKSGPL